MIATEIVAMIAAALFLWIPAVVKVMIKPLDHDIKWLKEMLQGILKSHEGR